MLCYNINYGKFSNNKEVEIKCTFMEYPWTFAQSEYINTTQGNCFINKAFNCKW